MRKGVKGERIVEVHETIIEEVKTDDPRHRYPLERASG
jgi:hypothetical protein